MIVESDSESKYADTAFKNFGYNDLEERFVDQGYDISLRNLSHSASVSINLEGNCPIEVQIPREIDEFGYFISVALAKTHSLTMITGALKNLFGLLPRKNQSFYHRCINEVIIYLNQRVRPNLSIIDAIVGLEGVIRGTPKRADLVIAGKKPASVDATLARVMGFDPERIFHIVGSEKLNLGSINPMVLGEDLEASIVKFKSPSGLSSKALISR